VAQRTAILTAVCPCTLTTLTPCTAQSLCTADCTCRSLQVFLFLTRSNHQHCSQEMYFLKLPAVSSRKCCLTAPNVLRNQLCTAIKRHQHLIKGVAEANVLGNVNKNMQQSTNMHSSMLACYLPLKPRATADSRCFCSCDGFFTVYSMKYMLFLALASSNLASCRAYCCSDHLSLDNPICRWTAHLSLDSSFVFRQLIYRGRLIRH